MRKKQIRDQVLMGKKRLVMWPEAEKRWLEEKSHKRSIIDDIRSFEWLQPYLYSYAVKDINKDLIEELAKRKEKEGVSPATVNRLLALIKAVLNKSAKEWEWIDKVPYIRMRKEPNIRIRWLTEEEVKNLITHLPPHLVSLVIFTLSTGLRAENVLNLKWENIHGNVLVIDAAHTKSKRHFSVPLNADALKVLEACKGADSTYVFTYKGSRIRQCNTKAWRKALKLAGIKDFRWHDLRHTWASWHVMKGTSLQEIQQLGDWSNFNMVLRYAHLSRSHLEKAANRLSSPID